MEPEHRFFNHYECPRCHETWADAWDSTCDDRCPSCNLTCSPHQSDEIAPSSVDGRPPDDRTARIRQLNDTLRTTFTGGRVMLTPGITALPEPTQRAVLHAIAAFKDFSADNDPHGEHDFVSVEVEGNRVFSKIDYYAPDFEHGSEDPSDPEKTIRVMTLLLAF